MHHQLHHAFLALNLTLFHSAKIIKDFQESSFLSTPTRTFAVEKANNHCATGAKVMWGFTPESVQCIFEGCSSLGRLFIGFVVLSTTIFPRHNFYDSQLRIGHPLCIHTHINIATGYETTAIGDSSEIEQSHIPIYTIHWPKEYITLLISRDNALSLTTKNSTNDTFLPSKSL